MHQLSANDFTVEVAEFAQILPLLLAKNMANAFLNPMFLASTNLRLIAHFQHQPFSML